MRKVTIVTDLGPGDGGKGSIINAMVCREKPDIIIKRGGAQGSHGVVKSDGKKFNFSQWGCGTLEGVPTYLSEQMVIMPVGLENEAHALLDGYFTGVSNPYSMISCHPRAICATPYHKIASQIEELLLRDNPRGTVGTGVGQSYRMSQDPVTADCTIRAEILDSPETVHTKLEAQASFYREKYRKVDSPDVLPEDAVLLKENLTLLYDDEYLDFIFKEFRRFGSWLVIEDLESILKRYDTAIVECSHGVLTDAVTGLEPHVSAIRTLPIFSEKMLRDAGFSGEIQHLAVHRAYEYRHGAGPMPTYDPGFTAKLPMAAHKAENRWQGKIRAGQLSADLLTHALEACFQTRFDGLALTWFDQILKPGMGAYLSHTINLLLQIHEKLPVKIVSLGPTEKDKIFL